LIHPEIKIGSSGEFVANWTILPWTQKSTFAGPYDFENDSVDFTHNEVLLGLFGDESIVELHVFKMDLRGVSVFIGDEKQSITKSSENATDFFFGAGLEWSQHGFDTRMGEEFNSSIVRESSLSPSSGGCKSEDGPRSELPRRRDALVLARVLLAGAIIPIEYTDDHTLKCTRNDGARVTTKEV
jgi:hypothetical protein